MKTRRRRTQHHWTHDASVTPHSNKSLAASPPESREPARDSGNDLHLGPYEDSYDVALGYGFERAIVTP